MLLFAVPLRYKIGWIAQHVFGQLVFAACNSNLPWYHDIPQQLHKTDNICQRNMLMSLYDTLPLHDHWSTHIGACIASNDERVML